MTRSSWFEKCAHQNTPYLVIHLSNSRLAHKVRKYEFLEVLNHLVKEFSYQNFFVINVPDSLDICPDTLGYTRILRIFTRIVWKGTFFWHFRCDRSDRSVRPVWPVQPGNCHLPSPRCKTVKIFSLFTVLPPTSPLFHPCAAPLHIPLSIFTPLEIRSSSPRILGFITCIGLKGGNQSVVKQVLKFLTSSSLFQGITCFPCPIS